jgi:two-component system, OmpR family, response regulator
MDLNTKILIVDDDKGIRAAISKFLKNHGFHTAVAANPMEMRQHLENERFDLIVLDVMMPKEDGLTALRRLQPGGPAVIMLSAVGTDIDRIIGLEMGADDYLAKPCNPRELLARIRSVLRRRAEPQPDHAPEPADMAEASPSPSLHFDGWRMDLGMHLLFDPANRVITLTDGEYRLLLAFAEHPRRVLTRDQLLEWSRGDDSDHFDRAIDVQLSRLRRKLAGAGDLIRTVRNEGYVFAPQVTRD